MVRENLRGSKAVTALQEESCCNLSQVTVTGCRPGLTSVLVIQQAGKGHASGIQNYVSHPIDLFTMKLRLRFSP